MRHYTGHFFIPYLFAATLLCSSVILGFSLIGCRGNAAPPEQEIVIEPAKMDDKVKEIIAGSLKYAAGKKGKLDDSSLLFQWPALTKIYAENNFTPIWSSKEEWQPQGQSLINFIREAKLYGLFPEVYHFNRLSSINQLFFEDSLKNSFRKDAALWARADLMLSDALINIIHDIKLGRLPQDSITLRKDSVLKEEFVLEKFNAVVAGISPDTVASSLEPIHKGYQDLKNALKKFLEIADFTTASQIVFPDSNSKNLQYHVAKRLSELGYLDSNFLDIDSIKLAVVLKKYQKENHLIDDGKIGAQTVRMLNLDDLQKFKQIAITLDRYKMLPEKMPEKYIWVNIPSYNLRLFSNDTIIINSRVVVGKQKTRTPVLTSSISEMITYPQWVIPQSIIVKEILPAVKKNPAYLEKKGYGLFDSKGGEVDPFNVDWSKYTKGIPYRVIQGSGDANALGVLKFNFSNKYAVYLHDTNQRSFFGLTARALSHGCVRVQDWEKMAYYIMENEMSSGSVNKKANSITVDSLTHWLKVKEKKNIPLRSKIPVFIRYFTCEASNGKISFYDDIYNEDKEMTDQLFAHLKRNE